MQNKPYVVAIGEILWDLFPSGPRFGGAPANFGYHAAALGADVSIISGVGHDPLGDEAIKNLTTAGINTQFVGRHDQYPTGTVDVAVDRDGHASYSFHPNEAWDFISATAAMHDSIGRADAICFGTLAQRSEVSGQSIRSLVSAAPSSTMRVLDLNMRPPFDNDTTITESLELATVLKLNDDELRHVAGMFNILGNEITQAKAIIQQFGLDWIALTCGSRGGAIISIDDFVEATAHETQVIDTVGAGDSFTAAVVVGWLRGISKDSILPAACRIAEFVCSQPGATPPLPDALSKVETW